VRILLYPPTGEINLSADQAELTELAALVASGNGTMTSQDTSGDVPGDTALTRIHVRVADSEVMIAADTDTRSLTITGNLRTLHILASNLTEMAQADDGGHLHIEHYPDHPYITEDSLPLVVNSPHGGMPTR
jgi:hypothetical protein